MEHWIWEDSKRFKWWMEILLLTNHTDKVFVGGKIQMIKGSFHTSEVKLSERWNVSRNTVRKFLKLLQNDNMITTKRQVTEQLLKCITMMFIKEIMK